MKITLEDLEKKILSLKDLELSRQEVLKRTRSYVDLCIDISTFQELKEIVFRHIPKKTFSTAPRKKYEWIEIRKDGSEHIHLDYWRSLPKEERAKRRTGIVRLCLKDRPIHKTKGYQSYGKATLPQGKDVYVVDKYTRKAYKLKQGNFYLYDITRLGIHVDNNISIWDAKLLYKKQNKPKPTIRRQVIKLSADKAITPERRFVKGNEQLYSLAYNPKKQTLDSNIANAKDEDIIFETLSWKLIPKEFKQYLTRKQVGMVLTEKGKLEKENLYRKCVRIDSKGNRRIERRPRIITLITETTIDHTIPPKGQERKSKYIAPPKPNLAKQTARMETKILRVKHTSHKLELSRIASKKKRTHKKPLKTNQLRKRSLGVKKFLQKLGLFPKDTKDTLTLRKENTLKNRELRQKRRTYNAAKKLKNNPNAVVKVRKEKQPKTVKKETKISTYEQERTAKIKLAFQKRTETLRKHKLKKKFDIVRAYYKYKKEHDTKGNNKR